jgi:phenylalanyl-tRNA synthetase beta chain
MWRDRDGDAMDFYDLKGVAEALLAGVRADGVCFQPAVHPTYRPGRTAEIQAGGRRIGVLGELHPRVRGAWGLLETLPVLLADIDLVALREASGDVTRVDDVPRFPASVEDLAIVVNDDVPAAEVELAVRRAGGSLLREVRLFDVYRGEQVGANKKSLAYSLTYQAEDRTLSDKDVEKLRSRIIRAVEGQLGATVRKR